MRYQSNIKQISDGLQKKLSALKNQEPVIRKIAVHLRSENDVRVFANGQKADGSQIGTYSASYLRSRVRGTSSPKKTKFTSDPKVILRNEGLLKEDFKLIAIRGGWGVGFSTARSAELVPKLEKQYGNNIWGISAKDEKDIDELLNDELRNKLK